MTAPTERQRDRIGSREWLEALPFDERLKITAVWAHFIEGSIGYSGDEGTLTHLKWAVAQIERLQAELAEVKAHHAHVMGMAEKRTAEATKLRKRVAELEAERGEVGAPDFFRPGRTYTRQHHGHRIEFRVEHVATPPGASRPIAFGWRKEPCISAWAPEDADDLDGWTEAGDQPC